MDVSTSDFAFDIVSKAKVESGKWKVESVNDKVERRKLLFHVEYDIAWKTSKTVFRSTFASTKTKASKRMR